MTVATIQLCRYGHARRWKICPSCSELATGKAASRRWHREFQENFPQHRRPVRLRPLA